MAGESFLSSVQIELGSASSNRDPQTRQCLPLSHTTSPQPVIPGLAWHPPAWHPGGLVQSLAWGGVTSTPVKCLKLVLMVGHLKTLDKKNQTDFPKGGHILVCSIIFKDGCFCTSVLAIVFFSAHLICEPSYLIHFHLCFYYLGG